MDIQGSFDSTTFAVIQEALERCDAGRTAIRWIVNMLKCRNIDLTYQGENVEPRVVKGYTHKEYCHLCCGVLLLTACS